VTFAESPNAGVGLREWVKQSLGKMKDNVIDACMQANKGKMDYLTSETKN
jgi:hypothetical protein